VPSLTSESWLAQLKQVAQCVTSRHDSAGCCSARLLRTRIIQRHWVMLFVKLLTAWNK